MRTISLIIYLSTPMKLPFAASNAGQTDHIVSSDYKTIKKSAVHRLFTAHKPKTRQIPRLFLFDCCDGDEAREAGVFRDEEEEEQHKSGLKPYVQSNNVSHVALAPEADPDPLRPNREALKKLDSTKHIERELSIKAGTAGSWLEAEKNPDYRLITIHAANEGFQSKLNTETGSYVITEFVERMSENIENENKKWIFEVFDEIQSVLHRSGKQLTDNKYNNNMRYLKFLRNGNYEFNAECTDGAAEVMIESHGNINAKQTASDSISLSNRNVDSNALVSDQEAEAVELQTITQIKSASGSSLPQTTGANSIKDEAKEDGSLDEVEDDGDINQN